MSTTTILHTNWGFPTHAGGDMPHNSSSNKSHHGTTTPRGHTYRVTVSHGTNEDAVKETIMDYCAKRFQVLSAGKQKGPCESSIH